MPLVLHPKTIGAPHWELMQPGDLSDWLTQYLQISPVDPSQKRWRTVPFAIGLSYPCRIDATWRKPVTWRAKVSAAWAALPKVAHHVYRKVFPET